MDFYCLVSRELTVPPAPLPDSVSAPGCSGVLEPYGVLLLESVTLPYSGQHPHPQAENDPTSRHPLVGSSWSRGKETIQNWVSDSWDSFS